MNPTCQKCQTQLKDGQHLSDLGTCPKCVSEWVLDYKRLHDRRFGKRSKAVTK